MSVGPIDSSVLRAVALELSLKGVPPDGSMVVAEAVYLLTRELGPHAEPTFYDAIIDGTLTVEPLSTADWQRIRDLVDRYQNLPLGGTDASLIAFADHLGATRIAGFCFRNHSGLSVFTVADLAWLIGVLEDWLLHASDDTSADLAAFVGHGAFSRPADQHAREPARTD